MNQFTENAIKVILSVPKGKVLTYGKVALLAGSPRGARQVGWLLNSMTAKYNLPWHRIVNAKGKIALSHPHASFEQRHLLEAEGIEFKDEVTIDLKNYLWQVTHIDFDRIELETR